MNAVIDARHLPPLLAGPASAWAVPTSLRTPDVDAPDPSAPTYGWMRLAAERQSLRPPLDAELERRRWRRLDVFAWLVGAVAVAWLASLWVVLVAVAAAAMGSLLARLPSPSCLGVDAASRARDAMARRLGAQLTARLGRGAREEVARLSAIVERVRAHEPRAPLYPVEQLDELLLSAIERAAELEELMEAIDLVARASEHCDDQPHLLRVRALEARAADVCRERAAAIGRDLEATSHAIRIAYAHTIATACDADQLHAALAPTLADTEVIGEATRELFESAGTRARPRGC